MKIIIIGAGGRLGAALVREWQGQFDVTGFDHRQLDIGDFDALRETLRRPRFDLLVNCAAQTNVDRCETEKEEAFRLNGEAPGVLAEICSRKGARMLHVSTDYVFAGDRTDSYSETDVAQPVSVYGESKLEGERCVAAVDKRHWVVRVSWVFGPDRPSFVDAMMKRAMTEGRVDAIADKTSTPTYTRDLAQWLPRIFKSEEGGLLHLANGGQCTWQEYAQHALDCCRNEGIGLKAGTVGALKLEEMKNFLARRPRYTVLSTQRFQAITGEVPRSWRDAVAEYVRDYYSKK
jgi:dTDP-4-dehydrorhamnose reductase